MKTMRVRRMGAEKVLAVPKGLAEKIQVHYMAVRLDDAGRLIYTPVPEVS